ncbi:MAG: hypothetical protein ACP5N3_02755 [Candidatus Nanoarchaeia archaeon]
MGILQLFGIGTKKTPEEITQLTSQEYLSRFLRIKTIVESNEQIMTNIDNVFCNEYLGEPLSKDLMYLGSGNSHIIHSIYPEPIYDNGREIMLALRLSRNDAHPYTLRSIEGDRDFQLFSELSSFCEAFIDGKNPSYFIGLVEWKDNEKFQNGVVGFLTEDLTKRKTLESRTRTERLSEYLEVTDKKGRTNTFFIDKIGVCSYTMDAVNYEQHLIKINKHH